MKFKHYIQLLLFCFSLSVGTHAQNEVPIGRSLKDSIKIGEPFQYAFSFSHDSKLEVFFPDSNYNFGDLEYLSKEIFTTKTSGNTSLDSVVYTFASFSTSKNLKLKLPVFILTPKGDTSVIWSKEYIINTKLMIKEVTDDLKLQQDTSYWKVTTLFNYLLLWAIIGIFIIALIATYILFGKKIIAKYKAKRLFKKHSAFISEFSKLTDKVETSIQAESALIIWKKYLDTFLNTQSLRTATSKEIAEIIGGDIINNALSSIDKAIYANQFENDLQDAFEVLRKLATMYFESEKSEIENGTK